MRWDVKFSFATSRLLGKKWMLARNQRLATTTSESGLGATLENRYCALSSTVVLYLGGNSKIDIVRYSN